MTLLQAVHVSALYAACMRLHVHLTIKLKGFPLTLLKHVSTLKININRHIFIKVNVYKVKRIAAQIPMYFLQNKENCKMKET